MSDASPVVDLEAVREVLERHPVDLGVLFGSHARGQPSVESDIDIAVAFDETVDEHDRLQARIDLIVDLVECLETDDVDVADLDTIRPAVGLHALRSGIILFGEQPRLERYLTRFERERTDDRETHEDRMKRLSEIVERLEAKL